MEGESGDGTRSWNQRNRKFELDKVVFVRGTLFNNPLDKKIY